MNWLAWSERRLLGHLICFPETWKMVRDVVASTDFLDPMASTAWAAAAECAEDGEPIDPVTLLRRMGEDAAPYLGGLLSEVTVNTPESVASWAHLIREESLKRQAITAAEAMAEATRAGKDPVEALAAAQATISGLVGWEGGAEDHSLQKATEALLSLFEHGDDPGRVKTNFPDLDRLLTNLTPGSMTALAGQTSGGKTAFALHCGDNIAAQGKRVMFVSLEMSGEEIQKRRIYREARLPESVYRGWEKAPYDPVAAARKAQAELARRPMRVRYGSFTASEIGKVARAEHRRGLDVLIVDYLGLITPSGEYESTEREINQAARAMKHLAMELGIVVLLLVQLNREGAKSDGAPELFHLRDSGSIEQHCDNVAFLYRNKQDDHGVITLVVRKQRNGRLGSCKFRFIGETFTFQSLAA